MYNVLIVDDESIICKGLSKIIDWGKYSFNIAGFAKNGQEAMEKIKKKDIHLVVADIRMPIMDGLELSRQIKAYNAKISVMIISGYSDFNYAKKAMEYDVKAYLLKPVIPDELLKQLEKIRLLLDEQLINEKEELEKNTILKDNLLYEFVNGYTTMEQIGNKFERYHIKIPGKMYTLALVNYNINSSIKRNMNETARTQKLKIRGSLENVVKEKKLGYVYKDIDGIFGIIFLLSRGMHKKEAFVEAALENIFRVITKNCGIETTIGFGIIRSELTDIKTCRKEAFLALERKIDHQEKRVFSYASYAVDGNPRNRRSVISDVIDYVDTHYCNNINVSMIADKFYLNSAYLGQLFKENTGIPFTQYISRKRIDEAKRLCLEGDLKVYQIIEKVGFKNPEYFYRQFKKYEGISFAKFREVSDNL